jgi:peptidyl-prolyl cis-trans isomerase B (cyclophilin B)
MSNKKKKNSNYQTAKRASSAAAAKKKKKKLSKDAVIGIICVAVILLAVVFTITFCALNDKDGSGSTGTVTGGIYKDDDTTVGKGACSYLTTRSTEGHTLKYVKMRVKDHGSIVLLLDATTAPVTVENFINLVNKGFYNGLTFHRIMENFMIQGGDPNANGTGGQLDENGEEINIKGEFDNNGHVNDIAHKRGVISMAREGNPYYPPLSYNTASSQFFICNTDYPSLDGDYAAFGYVIAGLDVVDSITAEGVKHASGGVINDKSKQPVITSIVEITEAEAMSYIK